MGTTASLTPTTRRPSTAVAGVLAFAASTVCTAIAVFGPRGQEDQVGLFPALVVAAAVMAALVAWSAVRPAVEGRATARRVVLLAALAAVALPVFWTGVPAVLAVAALAVRAHLPATPLANAGAVLAGLALLALLVAAVVA